MRWGLVLGCAACAGEDVDPPRPRWEPFAAEPVIRENPDAGLTLFLDVVLDAPTALRVTIDDGRRAWTQEVPAAVESEVLLLGFTPGSAYAVACVAIPAMLRPAPDPLRS